MPFSFNRTSFINSLSGYSGQQKLKFWCQTVLPLVYDDSLSYYELLNKVVSYLNNVINDMNTLETNMEALSGSYVELENFVNNELERFAHNINSFENEVNGRLDNFESEIVNEIDEFKAAINTEITQFENSVNSNIDNIEIEITTFIQITQDEITRFEASVTNTIDNFISETNVRLTNIKKSKTDFFENLIGVNDVNTGYKFDAVNREPVADANFNEMDMIAVESGKQYRYNAFDSANPPRDIIATVHCFTAKDYSTYVSSFIINSAITPNNLIFTVDDNIKFVCIDVPVSYYFCSLTEYNEFRNSVPPVALNYGESGINVENIYFDEGKKELITEVERLQTTKVDKETGKGLSHNDYSDADKRAVTALRELIDASNNGKVLGILNGELVAVEGGSSYPAWQGGNY